MPVCIAVVAIVIAALRPSARAAEPDETLRAIEGKWRGTVVRDEADPRRSVVEIRFHCDSDVPDDVIEQLVAFPQLRELGLIGGQHLTNQGLAHVAKLMQLERLELRNKKVTAEGLKHLAKLPKLKSLFLWDVALSKENAAALERLKSLEVLELRNVAVSADALASLKKLPELKQIQAFRCSGVFASEDDVRNALPDVKVTLSK